MTRMIHRYVLADSRSDGIPAIDGLPDCARCKSHAANSLLYARLTEVRHGYSASTSRFAIASGPSNRALHPAHSLLAEDVTGEGSPVYAATARNLAPDQIERTKYCRGNCHVDVT